MVIEAMRDNKQRQPICWAEDGHATIVYVSVSVLCKN